MLKLGRLVVGLDVVVVVIWLKRWVGWFFLGIRGLILGIKLFWLFLVLLISLVMKVGFFCCFLWLVGVSFRVILGGLVGGVLIMGCWEVILSVFNRLG